MGALENFVQKINTVIVNPIIQLLFGVALVVFLWGVFEFIRDSDSPEARNTGIQHIFWGVIGMAIMISVFGIMNIMLTTFGIDVKIP